MYFLEDHVKSVFFKINRCNKSSSYDYKFDANRGHPWTIKETLNQTLTITTILETDQNQTLIGLFNVAENGTSTAVLRQPLKKIINLPSNYSTDLSCSNFRKNPKICIPSISKRGGTVVKCSGELLFSDSFQDMDKWKHYVGFRIAHPYREGVAFKNSEPNSYIKNKTLHFKVTKSTKETYLNDCSYNDIYEYNTNLICGVRNKKQVKFFKENVMPPFDSAMLKSKEKFKYCRIDIEAKVAHGDFLLSGNLLVIDTILSYYIKF